MAKTLTEHLGSAYHRAQVGADRRGAIDALREAFQDDVVRMHAEAEFERLALMHQPKPGQMSRFSLSGRTACHLSRVQHDLLKAALGR